MNFGLSNNDIDSIKSVFSKYLLIDQVILYGSRAMGNYKPASDIDLTLIGVNLDSTIQNNLEFDLDDLMLPYKFDISIFDQITNPDIKDHINRVGISIYNRKAKTLN